MRLFDTHAHLDDEQFATNLPQILKRAQQAGVARIVCIGTSAASSDSCLNLVSQYPYLLHAAVGIQPNYCAAAKPEDWDRILELSQRSGVVAIGETGLDRYWDYTPFEMQQDYFDRHLRLSQQTNKPFVVHMRDCMDDILNMLREARSRASLSGIMHSYTGDAIGAQECIDLGLHISFAGMVTFKKSELLRSVASSVALDRILIETDAPYLSPHPKRSIRPNEPGLIVHTAQCLAAEFGMDLARFAETTFRNAAKLFGV